MTVRVLAAALLVTAGAGCLGAAATPADPLPDTSTPIAVVQEFLLAVEARDVERIGATFADDAPAEFDALRDGTVSADEVERNAQTISGSRAVRAEWTDGRMIVHVEGPRWSERIWVVETPAGWRILDF
ncbi:MAG: hypothetical protein AAGK21_15340 [Bacteroidota bacterium]